MCHTVQASLGAELQLVDLTQAPLLNAQENLKKNESDIMAALDQLHKEYQSVKTLLDRCAIMLCNIVVSIIHVHNIILSWNFFVFHSYRENPSLGDPNSLIEELLEMRNKIRIKETDLIMIRGKVSWCTSSYLHIR